MHNKMEIADEEFWNTSGDSSPLWDFFPVWEVVALGNTTPPLHYSLQSMEWKPTQGIGASLRTLYVGPLVLYWSHDPSLWHRSGKGLCD